MDNYKLVSAIKCRPELWDRSNPYFRDIVLKEKLWENLGVQMQSTGNICKEVFKGLREKYIREREKLNLYGDKYRPWDLLSHLKFLDNQIVPRKQSIYSETIKDNEESKIQNANNLVAFSEFNAIETDKTLIELVKKFTPIWDWRSNGYPSKQMKSEIWTTIANELKKKPTACKLRWKALREKYIREKMKAKDGCDKWELLESMSFLDKVIQYRKKQKNYDDHWMSQDHPTISAEAIFGASFSNNWKFHEVNDNSLNTNENSEDIMMHDIKQEYNSDVPDSSYESDSTRKRSMSIHSENSDSKRSKSEEKSPEKLFGDLVASLLLRKSENDRQRMMIEIMKVLATD